MNDPPLVTVIVPAHDQRRFVQPPPFDRRRRDTPDGADAPVESRPD